MFRVMKAKNAEPLEIHGIRLGPELTEEQAKAIFAFGEQTSCTGRSCVPWPPIASMTVRIESSRVR